MVGAKDPALNSFQSFYLGVWRGLSDARFEAFCAGLPETIKFSNIMWSLLKRKSCCSRCSENTPQMSRMQLADQQSAMKVGSGWTVPIVDDFNRT
jgi:hypothetical protein